MKLNLKKSLRCFCFSKVLLLLIILNSAAIEKANAETKAGYGLNIVKGEPSVLKLDQDITLTFTVFNTRRTHDGFYGLPLQNLKIKIIPREYFYYATDSKGTRRPYFGEPVGGVTLVSGENCSQIDFGVECIAEQTVDPFGNVTFVLTLRLDFDTYANNPYLHRTGYAALFFNYSYIGTPIEGGLLNFDVPISFDRPPVATSTPIVVKTIPPTPTATRTPTATPVVIKTPSPTPVATRTPTATPIATKTPLATSTPIRASTATPIVIKTASPTPINTRAPTNIATMTPAPFTGASCGTKESCACLGCESQDISNIMAKISNSVTVSATAVATGALAKLKEYQRSKKNSFMVKISARVVKSLNRDLADLIEDFGNFNSVCVSNKFCTKISNDKYTTEISEIMQDFKELSIELARDLRKHPKTAKAVREIRKSALAAYAGGLEALEDLPAVTSVCSQTDEALVCG